MDLKNKDIQPEEFILDGQQRLTSLTQVLMLDKPVKTFDEKGCLIKLSPNFLVCIYIKEYLILCGIFFSWNSAFLKVWEH
ncbi:hypothetical protein AYK86_05830 [Acinetobacter venetianus]|nr:hypothetical protein AYK86_05830 [Acinetobacter venetianus]